MSNASEAAGHDRIQGLEAKVAAASVVYLDHAATTPMIPAAFEAMTEELAQLGNPSSLHSAGRRARRVVEESRELIAEAYGARPSEVVFTSGGTEADNLAVKGLYWARRAAEPRRRRVLASATEHHAVLDSVSWLAEHEDAQADWLSVQSEGVVSAATLVNAIEEDPTSAALISIMWANNEVGSIQPIAELAALAAEHQIPFHSDAVQAAGQLPVSLAESGATALTITAHKIGGPVGVGALLLARGAQPVPIVHGGGQERDVRSGTLDVPAIRAFAVAVQVATEQREDETKRLTALCGEPVV
jgi:cysteine desulfurase